MLRYLDFILLVLGSHEVMLHRSDQSFRNIGSWQDTNVGIMGE